MTLRNAAVTLVALLALGGAAPAPADAAVRTGPSGDAFYTPPKPLPGERHGDVIWVRKLKGEQTLLQAGANLLVLYRSTSVSGKPIAVSGTIHLPKGKAPKGGWPVVSWAHATSGIGDQCAPSRNPGEGAIHAYHVYIESLLDRWLAAGFAIVRTDYEGLGTKGVHPYLVGTSEARGVLDIVRAARQYSSRVGTRLAVAGHSQGGHATVFANAIARKWTPELSLRGTVAFAPFAKGDEVFAALSGSDEPSAQRAGYAALFLRGLAGAYPKLDAPSVLSDRGRELYPFTLSRCITELGSEFAGTAPRDLFAQGADLEPLRQAIARNDPSDLRLGAPLLVEQGNADTTVLPGLTTIMVEDLAERGGKVTYKLHDDIDHTTVAFGEPQDEAFSWVRKRLK